MSQAQRNYNEKPVSFLGIERSIGMEKYPYVHSSDIVLRMATQLLG
jgi:hypothetical protein